MLSKNNHILLFTKDAQLASSLKKILNKSFDIEHEPDENKISEHLKNDSFSLLFWDFASDSSPTKYIESQSSKTRSLIALIDSASDIKKVFKQRGNDYVFKPLNEDEVLSKVKLHLDFHQISNENKELTQTEKKLSEIEKFYHTAAHDLRGPIVSMEGICNLPFIDEPEQENKALEYFRMIKGEINNVHRLNTAVITIGNIRFHKIKPAKIDLSTMIRYIVQKYQNSTESQHVSFDLDLPRDFFIRSDKFLLEIIIENLVKNAVDFAKKPLNHFLPKVRVILNEKGKNCELQVADNGIGMNEITRKKAFDMFFIGTDESKGFGLGLYQVKLAAERLNAKIQCDSQAGEKTVFSVKLEQINE